MPHVENLVLRTIDKEGKTDYKYCMEKKSSSIRRIAQLANVSPMTVSYALRNSSRISEEKREKILKIAEAEGYRVNPLVSTLMSQLKMEKRSGTIGTLGFINCFENRRQWSIGTIRPRFFKGMVERAEEFGYKIEEYYIKAPGMTSAKLSRILRRRNIGGIIIGSLPIARGHLSLKWDWFAAAAHGHTLVKPALHRVDVNHTLIMLMALRKLKKLGYKKVGYIGTALSQANTQTIFPSIYAFNSPLLFKQTLPILNIFTQYQGDIRQKEYDQVRAWYYENRPDAVISVNTLALKGLKKIGLRVPGDIGYVNLGIVPGEDVSGLDCRHEAIGASAVDLVVTQLNTKERGIPKLPQLLLTEPTWFNGTTVRKR